ncbi:hypothetical protein T492DRAFT_840863 [Pavlovales sp. CCMP2436]|nr:hypothetical protein T492DRAFT_840863 [Pavlovales sp. CCMP2436]
MEARAGLPVRLVATFACRRDLVLGDQFIHRNGRRFRLQRPPERVKSCITADAAAPAQGVYGRRWPAAGGHNGALNVEAKDRALRVAQRRRPPLARAAHGDPVRLAVVAVHLEERFDDMIGNHMWLDENRRVNIYLKFHKTKGHIGPRKVLASLDDVAKVNRQEVVKYRNFYCITEDGQPAMEVRVIFAPQNTAERMERRVAKNTNSIDVLAVLAG